MAYAMGTYDGDHSLVGKGSRSRKRNHTDDGPGKQKSRRMKRRESESERKSNGRRPYEISPFFLRNRDWNGTFLVSCHGSRSLVQWCDLSRNRDSHRTAYEH